ncbi:MAG: hypothetical protein QN178_17895 [Armatimonadota bacterium]|nr:hypothetical protein [Armatimonadota bacterium]
MPVYVEIEASLRGEVGAPQHRADVEDRNPAPCADVDDVCLDPVFEGWVLQREPHDIGGPHHQIGSASLDLPPAGDQEHEEGSAGGLDVVPEASQNLLGGSERRPILVRSSFEKLHLAQALEHTAMAGPLSPEIAFALVCRRRGKPNCGCHILERSSPQGMTEEQAQAAVPE